MARQLAASLRNDPDSIPTEILWREYKKKSSKPLKAELIRRHVTLVRFVAERVIANLPKSVELDDLIQEGTFGLMDAIEKFDYERGIKFKTYCSTRIRGAILDALRSQDWVPRLVRQRAGKLERLRQEWLTRYGCEPSDAALAQALEVDECGVGKAIEKAEPRSMLSVSDRRPSDAEGGHPQIDTLGESDEDAPVDLAHRHDLMEVITRVLQPKERFILEQYYLEGLTLREIGEHLNLTESRVCQIHSNVIKRLRDRLDLEALH